MVLFSAVTLWGDDVDGDIDDAVGCGWAVVKMLMTTVMKAMLILMIMMILKVIALWGDHGWQLGVKSSADDDEMVVLKMMIVLLKLVMLLVIMMLKLAR